VLRGIGAGARNPQAAAFMLPGDDTDRSAIGEQRFEAQRAGAARQATSCRPGTF
jgi:hypothetical protein